MGKNRITLREPSLEEMLADPIIWMVMKSDQVEEHELRGLLKLVAAELAQEAASQSGSVGAAESDGNYRRGVGIMLLDRKDRVLVGRRRDSRGTRWQMPQGGIEEGEEPRDAAFRELKEEVGSEKAEIIAESEAWLRYDLPPGLRKRWANRYRGQQQKWFVMRFQGTDSDINIATEHPEFSAWKWVPIEQLPDLIVSFKRQLYIDLLREVQKTGTVRKLAR
jgi:putative (di)nucleoside polyphosphate hydrolase